MAESSKAPPDLAPDETEEAFAEGLAAVIAQEKAQSRFIPSLPAAALSCAVLDGFDRIAWQDHRFSTWLDRETLDADVARQVRRTGGVALGQGFDLNGYALTCVYASSPAAAQWPIAPDPATLTRLGTKAVIVVVVSLSFLDDELIAIGRAFGMTLAQARMSAALVRFGALPQAAAFCNVSYETARETIEAARRKTNSSRLTQLVSKLTSLVTSAQPAVETVEHVLVDVFGLSVREAKLALVLTQAGTRGQAAKMAGLSEAAAKSAFATLFERLGVTSAPQLSRMLNETIASALLVGASQSDLPPMPVRKEELALIPRPNGTYIAYTDYGPSRGKPVIVTHSGSATRLVPASFVQRLQAAGFRPIAIDRPGFGLSEMNPDLSDPWTAAGEDMATLVQRLGSGPVDFIVRGGVYGVCALARAAPETMGQVVAMNPDVSTFESHKRQGAIGMIWKTGERFPEQQAAVTKWLATHTTPARSAQFTRLMLRHSPPDLEALLRPEETEDHQRSIALFSSGRVEGTIGEHQEHLKGVICPPILDGSKWTILMGAFDPMHHVEDMTRFWTTRLPNARFHQVSDGGRYLHLSHPDVVIAHLKGTTS
jgi:pimeloyl-ACP methyl ester carboxylesterase/DNA-binding CsgD family transcriptional regulator